MNQKIYSAESGQEVSYQWLQAAIGWWKASMCSPHALTCFLEEEKGEVAATEELQEDNKLRLDCMDICVQCSKLISNQPSHKQTFG